MEKYIIKNCIKYELHGDIYYPMLKLDEQNNYQIANMDVCILTISNNIAKLDTIDLSIILYYHVKPNISN